MQIKANALTAEAFAPFGDVVEARGDRTVDINEGTSTRFHDLARIDVELENGRPLVNIFRASPYPKPLTLKMMEKHPLGSQLFMPLEKHAYLVAVAPAGEEVHSEDLVVFLAQAWRCAPCRPADTSPPIPQWMTCLWEALHAIDESSKNSSVPPLVLDYANYVLHNCETIRDESGRELYRPVLLFTGGDSERNLLRCLLAIESVSAQCQCSAWIERDISTVWAAW